MSESYEVVAERLAGVDGTIVVLGAADTGKTTLGRALVADALAAGRVAAYVDGDVAADTVGPPTCVGLRILRDPAELDDLRRPDELRFVGALDPSGVLLPEVVGVASLVEAARSADRVVVDTPGRIAGVVGETLAYHLVELLRPDVVVALEVGEELEPVVAMLRRFLSANVLVAAPPDGLVPRSPLERVEDRRAAFARAFGSDLTRWRIHPGVVAPTLPEGFDLERLDGMLVGIHDDRGRCLGLGALEVEGPAVRVLTRHGDAMRGLRLGSMRIDLETFETVPVRLRQLIFGI